MKGLRTAVVICMLVMSLPSSLSIECPKDLSGCKNCIQKSASHFQVLCGKGKDLRFKPHFDVQHMQTTVVNSSKLLVKIRCKLRPNWSDFHLRMAKKLKDVSKLILKGCDLPEDRKLISIIDQFIDNNRTKVNEHDKMTLEIDSLSLKRNKSLLSKNFFEGFENYDTIGITKYNLQNLPDDLFQNFNCSKLKLAQNNLHTISPKFFNSSSLLYLHLNGNKLQTIKNMTFANLPMLRELHLFSNQLTTIESKSFDKNSNLEILSLSLNYLTALPEHIFDSLHNLKILKLTHNFFSAHSFPRDLFQNNAKLEVIVLQSNKANLTTFSTPDIFKSQTNLQKLYLDRNGLIILPPDLLRNLGELNHLTLSWNYLKTIPEWFFNGCKKLAHLDLSLNQITQISANVFSELNIKVLLMIGNKVRYLDLNTFRSTSQLTEVDFTNNRLQIINSSQFQDGVKVNLSPFHYSRGSIEVLKLGGNNISEIYDDWLSAPRIKQLDLMNNQLTYLSHANIQFASREKVVTVNLSNNQIRKIDFRMLDDSLKNNTNYSKVILSLNDNPVECDCSIEYLLRHHQNLTSVISQNLFYIEMYNLNCAKPSELQNVSVKNLNLTSLLCVTEPITCPVNCNCSHRTWDQAHLINCSHRGLTEVPAAVNLDSIQHVELNLTGNSLKSLPSLSQLGYRNVTVLSLSHNQISSLSLSNWSENLTQLLLHGNNLIQLSNEDIRFMANNLTKLQTLTLHANPWICNCDTLDFLDLIQTNQLKFSELQQVTCSLGDTPIFKIIRDDMCPASVVSILAASVTFIFLLSSGILITVYYRYKMEVKVWLISQQLLLCLVTETELDRDKIYDAFVSYSHKDEDFVVNTLMPKLEGGSRPFKLCLHYRDWLVGEFIGEQIARSVADSRRTIVVLSRNFLESEWGRMEFRTAHNTALKEGRNRVIIIIYGDIGPVDELEPELASYMRSSTYVQWGESWFWQKLYYALPH